MEEIEETMGNWRKMNKKKCKNDRQRIRRNGRMKDNEEDMKISLQYLS